MRVLENKQGLSLAMNRFLGGSGGGVDGETRATHENKADRI